MNMETTSLSRMIIQTCSQIRTENNVAKIKFKIILFEKNSPPCDISGKQYRDKTRALKILLTILSNH